MWKKKGDNPPLEITTIKSLVCILLVYFLCIYSIMGSLGHTSATYIFHSKTLLFSHNIVWCQHTSYICHFFFFFFFSLIVCGILAPWPGFEPIPFAVKAQSLNHWTTREVLSFFKKKNKQTKPFIHLGASGLSCDTQVIWDLSLRHVGLVAPHMGS